MSKRKIIGLCILVVLFTVVLGVTVSSYAYLRIQTTQSNSNTVKTLECLSVSITGNNEINLTNAYAISDDKGKETTPYTFTVKNDCTTSVIATIKLKAQSTSTLGYQYIKYAFNNTQESNQTVAILNEETKILASNVVLDNKASKTYELRLWIDEDTTWENGKDKIYSGKIEVEAVPNN
jgi:hypothetical protein